MRGRGGVALSILAATSIGGCAGTPEQTPPAESMSVMLDLEQSVFKRVAAAEDVRAAADAGRIDRAEARKAFKQIVWETGNPISLRVEAVRAVLADETELEDSRRFAGLRLPTEPSLLVVAELADAARAHGWVDLTGPLIRSYARPAADVAEIDRPERQALEALHPGIRVELVALEVFVDPEAGEGGSDLVDRTRRAAWDLLGRLDVDGSIRLGLIEDDDALGEERSALVERVRVCALELRTIPITGDQLTWLASLEASRGVPGGWWETSRDIIDGLDMEQRMGLHLRHMEPLRWARANRPDLLAMSRDALLEEVRSRDAKRRHHRRISLESTTGPTRDRLNEWDHKLAWADLVTLIVVDDALREERVTQMLFGQADVDLADDSTEYGGLLLIAKDGGFEARMYPPRPSGRRGNHEFVASPEMMEVSEGALAHYHFHVQQEQNAEYAGPSPGDLEYAWTHGRTCVVLTSISKGVLGVDVYQPGGETVDLGELVR